MRVLLVGAGAVGQVYGWHLARGGAATSFLVRPRHAEALQALDRAVKADPKNALAHAYRGWAQAADRDFEAAFKSCDEAVRLAPDVAAVYFWRAEVYGASRDPDRALADYGEAIRRDPKDPWAFAQRGLHHALKKQWDKAVSDLDEAVRLDPTDANLHLGIAYLRAGNKQAAAQAFRKVTGSDGAADIARLWQRV